MEIYFITGIIALYIFQTVIMVRARRSDQTRYSDQLYSQKTEYEELIKDITSQLREAQQELQDSEREVIQLKEELKGARKINELHVNNREEMKKADEEKEEQLRASFKLMASEIMEANAEKFSNDSKLKLKDILSPLEKDLEAFKKEIMDSNREGTKERSSLKGEIKTLMELNRTISEGANNLASALRGNTKHQGNWGEMILESILKDSGLKEGLNYELQEYIKDEHGVKLRDEEGKKMQPDAIIKFPDGRVVIVDSKVSINAYVRMVETETKEEENLALAEHVQAVKNHIKDLSAKSYEMLDGSLDYKLMFVPNEPAYLAAINQAPGLWQEAYKKGIALVSPTTLITTLMLVKQLWNREVQNQNTEEVIRLATAMYEKFCSFTEIMSDVGEKLRLADKSYHDALKQLSTGKGNLLRQSERLKSFGINSKKEIKPRMMAQIENADLEE